MPSSISRISVWKEGAAVGVAGTVVVREAGVVMAAGSVVAVEVVEVATRGAVSVIDPFVPQAAAITVSATTQRVLVRSTTRSVPPAAHPSWQNGRMEEYGASTYGDRIADVYDDLYGDMDPSAAVGTLRELADGGPVLELAIGTGRVGIPLSEAGLSVVGIDASKAMVERLEAKNDAIPVTIGDFADVDVAGTFSLIYIVFNTFFGLLTQEDQIRCFANVASHLESGGRFVIEAFVPDLSRFNRGQRTNVTNIGTDSIRLDASIHDMALQRVDSQHMIVTGDSIKLYPVSIRYAYPSELDLMGRLAGLELEHRWAGWNRSPFTSSSGSHVSVYRK
jgi:SAM-dependent methyltransferase